MAKEVATQYQAALHFSELINTFSIMGILLAVHLGVVFGLFLSFPYGKFVHGFYRFTALIRHAHEQQRAKDNVNK